MATITAILGRDGMGDDADEAAFDAYVEYVNDHIDEACGFTVNVETHQPRDVQDTRVIGGTYEQRETVKYQLQEIWNAWCEQGAPGVFEVCCVQ